MKKQIWQEINRTVVFIAVAAVAGALAGATAALIVTPLDVTRLTLLNQTSSTIQVYGSTTTEPTFVRVEPRLVAPLLPPGFITRRASPVATVYSKAKGFSLEGRSLTPDKILGQAVALTSDGWLVTAALVTDQKRLADLTIWLNGKSYSVERGFADKINGVSFIKIEAADLYSPAFGDAMDLVAGSEIWLEPSASSLSPSLITLLSNDIPGVVSASSERAMRRMELHGVTQNGDLGSPAWDSKGALVGIIESTEGKPISILPSSSIATSFSSLLNNDLIQHAALGVYAVDLSAWRIDGERGALPSRGALLKANTQLGMPAVLKNSAASQAGLLAGDVILSVERDILDGTADLGEVLSEYRPDTEVTLRINREGEETDVKVKLGSVVTSEVLK